MLMSLAEQISIAVRNAQLFSDVHNARRESEILYRVSTIVNTTLSYPGIVQALVDEIGPVDYSISLSIFENYSLAGARYVDIVAIVPAGHSQAMPSNTRIQLSDERMAPT